MSLSANQRNLHGRLGRILEIISTAETGAMRALEKLECQEPGVQPRSQEQKDVPTVSDLLDLIEERAKGTQNTVNGLLAIL